MYPQTTSKSEHKINDGVVLGPNSLQVYNQVYSNNLQVNYFSVQIQINVQLLYMPSSCRILQLSSSE